MFGLSTAREPLLADAERNLTQSLLVPQSNFKKRTYMRGVGPRPIRRNRRLQTRGGPGEYDVKFGMVSSEVRRGIVPYDLPRESPAVRALTIGRDVPGPGSYRVPAPSGPRPFKFSTAPRKFAHIAEDPRPGIGPGGYDVRGGIGTSTTGARISRTKRLARHELNFGTPGPGQYGIPRKPDLRSTPGGIITLGERFPDAPGVHVAPQRPQSARMPRRDFVRENMSTAQQRRPERPRFSARHAARAQSAKARRDDIAQSRRQRALSSSTKAENRLLHRKQQAWLRIIAFALHTAQTKRDLLIFRTKGLALLSNRRENVLRLRFDLWKRHIEHIHRSRCAIRIQARARVFLIRIRIQAQHTNADKLRSFLEAAQGQSELVVRVRQFRQRVLCVQRWWKAKSISYNFALNMQINAWRKVDLIIRQFAAANPGGAAQEPRAAKAMESATHNVRTRDGAVRAWEIIGQKMEALGWGQRAITHEVRCVDGRMYKKLATDAVFAPDTLLQLSRQIYRERRLLALRRQAEWHQSMERFLSARATHGRSGKGSRAIAGAGLFTGDPAAQKKPWVGALPTSAVLARYILAVRLGGNSFATAYRSDIPADEMPGALWPLPLVRIG